MQASFSGVFPILATPFTDDGEIDVASQLRLVDHLLEQGVHGLGAFGNAGEGYALRPEERASLLDEIVRHVDGRAPVIVGVGTTGTASAVQACQQAEAQGAQGLMVLPPFYVKPDADGLRFFYASISDAVSIPIMVQDAPLLSQVAMPPPLLARMAREIEHVEYVKVEAPPTAPKISRTMESANGALTLFGGLNGQFMIEECQRGSRGIMPASDMAAVYVAIWNALQGGDLASAWDAFTRALPLIRYELQPGLGVSAIKHNLVSEGVIRSAFVRHPGRSLDAAGKRELEQLRSLVWPV
ncbi:MAG: dihydrodipicolinate synthase family protein [Acidobacteriia bacterium]|nr:dihydrodipicolinate synthase family protein [Terriglobia bacterium]MYK08905.1 dihydrodipicolinate synthase family protein [Terriglobia bacterium]